MNDILRSAVYGFAIGDALGVPYEFKDRGTFRCTNMIGGGTWGQRAGTWSDDTSMLLATCDSIRTRGKIDPEDMRVRFLRWYKDAEYTANNEVFDIGNTTAAALRCGKGIDNINANGNGSLMRILPLAFVPDLTVENIRDVSSITHAHEISVENCIKYVGIAQIFIRDKNVNLHTKARQKDIKSTGYVVDSLAAACWCVATSHSYSECVLRAVNLGGDTDTIAALSGGLAGIKYGYNAIPTDWIDKLANKELIERCLF